MENIYWLEAKMFFIHGIVLQMIARYVSLKYLKNH